MVGGDEWINGKLSGRNGISSCPTKGQTINNLDLADVSLLGFPTESYLHISSLELFR